MKNKKNSGQAGSLRNVGYRNKRCHYHLGSDKKGSVQCAG